MKKKKQWSMPKLIVLVRGKHNERVLVACKVSGTAGDPSTGAIQCYNAICAQCLATTGT